MVGIAKRRVGMNSILGGVGDKENIQGSRDWVVVIK